MIQVALQEVTLERVQRLLQGTTQEFLSGVSGRHHTEGKVFRLYMPAATHHHGALNGIFQLAHIARPVIVLQHFNGVRAEAEIGWSSDMLVLV